MLLIRQVPINSDQSKHKGKNGLQYFILTLQIFEISVDNEQVVSYVIQSLWSINYYYLFYANFTPTTHWFPSYSESPHISRTLRIIIIIIIIIIIYSFRVFHISWRWWFFTGVLVTASLLKSPGLFSVFWPSSIMLSFGWSPLVRQLPNPLGPLIIL